MFGKSWMLARKLQSDDLIERERATSALARLQNADAAKALLESLREQYVPRWQTENALRVVGEPAIPFLLQAYQDSNVREFRASIRSIVREIPDRRALSLWFDELKRGREIKTASAALRKIAARDPAAFSNAEHVTRVIVHFKAHRTPDLAHLLAEIGDPRGFPALVSLIRPHQANDGCRDAVSEMADSISKLIAKATPATPVPCLKAVLTLPDVIDYPYEEVEYGGYAGMGSDNISPSSFTTGGPVYFRSVKEAAQRLIDASPKATPE